MHAVMHIQGSGPSQKFLGKILAKKSKILARDLDLARRLRSCHILGKILAGIILAPWASWARSGQDLRQESWCVCVCVCVCVDVACS